MASGQTQLVYKDEEALTPRSIGDVQQMLERSRLGSQIKDYKIVSGIMFFEVTRTQYNVKRRGFTSYVRYHMVAGEDPKEKGCLVSMHLSPEARYLITLHMSTLWDTRGGIVNVAWCTAFQFKRRILRSGNDSRSYWAIRRARRNYCKALLRLLDDCLDLESQDWQAIQVCAGSHTTPYLANRYQKVIDDHKKLFKECRHYRYRNRSVEPGADDSEDHDDDPDHDSDQRRLTDAGPDEDDKPNEHNDDHGPGPNDSDDDDGNGQDWRTQLNRLRRDRQHGSGPENNEDNLPDDVPDLLDMQDDIDEDFNMGEDIDEDDRSSSPVFVPHSRQTSPETTRHPNDVGNLSEIDIDDFSEINNDHTVSTRSPTRLGSSELKLELKPDPDNEYQHTRSKPPHDVIDLTGDSDESMGGGSSIMEMIDLTEDSESVRTGNEHGPVIDLTEDSDTYQSPMDIIELDD
jgi:hypothetical protein